MKPYYQDDLVTLYHGDCREVTDWLAADVLITDPPYGIGWKRSANRARNSTAHDGIKNDEDTSMRDLALDMWGDRPGVVFGSFAASRPPRYKQTLVWAKPADAGVVGSVTGFRRDIEAVFLVGDWPKLPCRFSSVLRSNIPNIGSPTSPAGRTGHPHSKPLDLMEQLIAASPDGVIADPFAGSGSSLVAAKLQGRRAVGVELDERYCETAANRLSQGILNFGATA